MKILHLSRSKNDGGISNSVKSLYYSQQLLGFNSKWLKADNYPMFQRSFHIRNFLKKNKQEILHIHGLWSSPSRFSYLYKYKLNNYVVSPHGMLSPFSLKVSSFKKQIIWKLWEKEFIKSSSIIHALSFKEAKDIKKQFPEKSIAVIPNGVSLPTNTTCKDPLPWEKDIPSDAKILLYFGRFHQIKGLDSLIKAWEIISQKNKFQNWWLVLIGYGDNNYLNSLLSNRNLKNIKNYGPAFNELKHNIFCKSDAFILTSYSEALPIAALEAMSYGLPCLLTKECGLEDFFLDNSAFRINHDHQKLSNDIERFFVLSDEKQENIGKSGKNNVLKNYSWPDIALKTYKLYGWILKEMDKPNFII